MTKRPAPPHKWTQEQMNFMRENISGTPFKKLHEMINGKFGISLTLNQVRAYAKRNGLRNSRDMRFVKGQKSWNAGKKGLRFAGSEKGWFKKGQVPHNHKPIGSERICSSMDYAIVKIAEPDVWRAKHLHLWEQENGALPDNHAVIFGDGDRHNLELDNLVLVSRSQLAVMNRFNLIKNEVGLTRVGTSIADLKIKISERSG